MSVSTETLLMLVAAALYLFDSSLFLASNEAVLVRGGRGRWFARFGLDRWRLGGKEPYLPNPAAPQFALFKLSWRFDEAAAASSAPVRPVIVPPEIERFRLHVLVSLVCIFVLLPAALFYPRGIEYPIAIVAILYVNIVVALVRLFRSRAAFGLSAAAFTGLAFECLVCAPFSINLVRKLCARLRVDEDFVLAARRLLVAEALAAANAQCLRRLDEQIDYAAEGTATMASLVAGRGRFLEPKTR